MLVVFYTWSRTNRFSKFSEEFIFVVSRCRRFQAPKCVHFKPLFCRIHHFWEMYGMNGSREGTGMENPAAWTNLHRIPSLCVRRRCLKQDIRKKKKKAWYGNEKLRPVHFEWLGNFTEPLFLFIRICYLHISLVSMLVVTAIDLNISSAQLTELTVSPNLIFWSLQSGQVFLLSS